MEMPPGEIADRYTILRMKATFDKDAALKLGAYASEVERLLLEGKMAFAVHLLDLQEANSKIWMLEASMRQEYKEDPMAQQELDLAEYGRRAIEIRDINKLRVKAKKNIDDMFGFIPEGKVNHAST